MNETIHVDIAILGAGIAGLGAALGAKNASRKSIVFEANKSAGGLLDNFSVNGFRFDNAVHLSFATEPEVRSIFDQTPYYTHPSDSSNFEENKWLKHPVQNNLFPLSAADKVDLIDSFLSRPDIENIQNYEQWLVHQYGTKIAERFPLRYTRKYWQCEAKELSTTWIGNRMRRADFKELLHGSYTDETPNTYYTKEMRYPKKGGYKSFIEPIINEVNIFYEYKAISINLERKEIGFENGDVVIFKELVNTLPLPIFIELCGKCVPEKIKSAASKLEATSIDLISVGFNKPVIKDLWFYIYDEDIFASRAYSPSVKSKDNAPEGCSSLQFEIYNPGRESRFTPDELKKNVLFAINKMNIAEDMDILFCEHKHLSWGNVNFKIGMENYRKLVLDFMSQNNVKTAGRFGEWDYFWSNQSFLSGYNLYN